MLSALPDCSESRLARKEEPQLMTHPNRLPTTLEENGTTAKSTSLFVHVNIVRRSIMW
jgi:hypothetical protein